MIEFENVSFPIQRQEHGGLHDINLKISDGRMRPLFCSRSGAERQRSHGWNGCNSSILSRGTSWPCAGRWSEISNIPGVSDCC